MRWSSPAKLRFLPFPPSFVAALSVLLVFVLGAPVPAQRLLPKWHHLGQEDGLSQGTVYAILQDKTGFLWFGTGDGLNRYDGREFFVYRSDPQNANSLSDNVVRALMEDRTGLLWIGTQEGITSYDPSTGAFRQHKQAATDGQPLAMGTAPSLTEAATGEVWAGTEIGACLYDRPAGTFRLVPGDGVTVGEVRDVAVDSKGRVWAAGTNGLFVLEKGGRGFVRPECPRELVTTRLTCMIVDREDHLWAGSNEGILQWNLATGELTLHRHDPGRDRSLPSDEIYTIRQVAGDACMAGTRGGAWRVTRDGKSSRRFVRVVGTPNSLSDDKVLSVFVDRSRNIWLGTSRGGANHLYLLGGQFPHYVVNRMEPGRNAVRSVLHEQPGYLWVGTEEDGLFRCKLVGDELLHFVTDPVSPTSLASNRVSAIAKDGEGRLWVGAGTALHRLNPDIQTFTRFEPGGGDATHLLLDADGALWLGTTSGLFRFDPATETFTAYRHRAEDADSIGSDHVNALARTSEGTLWIGTADKGLQAYNAATGRFRHFEHDVEDAASLVSNEVLSLLVTEKDVVWAGTVSGLSRLDRKTGRFDHFRRQDGLSSEAISGILEGPGGELWLSTFGGVTRLDPAKRTVTNYDVWDGLQDYQFTPGSALKTSDEEMYFGGFNGFNAFFPDRIKANPYSPNVVLTQFRVFNELQQPSGSGVLGRPITVTKSIDLPHWKNVITFEFASLDFTAPSKNRYAYMLEGFDKDWIESGARGMATYTGLPGGVYTFRVKGTNNSGVWSREQASVVLRIKPPFWATWQFRLLVPVLLILAIHAAYRYRLRQSAKQQRELEKLVVEKTSALTMEAEQRERINADLVREIEVRARAEAALRQSESRFRALFEQAPIGISIVRDGRCLYINRAFRALFGHQPTDDALQGAEFSSLYSRESLDSVTQLMTPNVDQQSEAPAVTRVIGVRRDGSRFPLQLVVARVEMLDGPASVAFCLDLTEMEAAREKLERYARELEERNREVKQFAYIVSHDLKAPLVNIQGFTAELEKALAALQPAVGAGLSSLDERTRRLVSAASEEDIPEALTFIRSAVGRMDALVQALLKLSRIGRLELDRRPVPLREVTDDCLRSLAHMIVERGATVHVGEMPDVIADRTAIEQIMGNLLTNSVVYLDPARPGLIEVWGELNGERLYVHVKDNGRGIAESEMDKVFAPFRRAGRQDVPGEGMGLAYVQALIRRHGGSIDCRSKAGSGTTMTFWLPKLMEPSRIQENQE